MRYSSEQLELAKQLELANRLEEELVKMSLSIALTLSERIVSLLSPFLQVGGLEQLSLLIIRTSPSTNPSY